MSAPLIWLCLLFLATPLAAQRFQWHTEGGYVGVVNSYEGATDIARDGLGRHHLFDYASGTQTCQGTEVTAHAERGNYSTFLYSFDADGRLVRALVVGEDFRALAIEAGADGSVYMLGRSPRGKLILGTDTVVLRSHSNYVIKISPEGRLVWNRLVFQASGGSESMLLLHDDHLYVQSGQRSVAQLDTSGAVVRELTASYYKSQTAIQQLIFRGAHAFTNGDVLLAAISYGDVAFGADTLLTTNNTFLHVPMLMIRTSADLAMRWYRYPLQGLRNADIKTIPLVVDRNDDIYAGIQVSDTCIVGNDTLANRSGTYSGGLVKLNGAGSGVWGRLWTNTVLPWSVALRPNGTGVALAGITSNTATIGRFTLSGNFGKSLFALFTPDGEVDLATIAITGNYGTAAQVIRADVNGTYLLGGLLNGGDGVPIYSCEEGNKMRGFFVGRISEDPDSVPRPSIAQIGDSLHATPAFNGDIQWFLGGQPIEGATSRAIRILSNGLYSVRYAYQTGCVGTATSDVLNVTTSNVSMSAEATGIRLSPHPVADRLRVEVADSDVRHAEVIDVSGRVIERWDVDHGIIERSALHLPRGIYQLRLRSDTRVYSTSFIRW